MTMFGVWNGGTAIVGNSHIGKYASLIECLGKVYCNFVSLKALGFFPVLGGALCHEELQPQSLPFFEDCCYSWCAKSCISDKRSFVGYLLYQLQLTYVFIYTYISYISMIMIFCQLSFLLLLLSYIDIHKIYVFIHCYRHINCKLDCLHHQMLYSFSAFKKSSISRMLRSMKPW